MENKTVDYGPKKTVEKRIKALEDKLDSMKPIVTLMEEHLKKLIAYTESLERIKH
jgi:hypothetical protein